MEDQSCKNCKYFVQHYVKHGSNMTAINCGNCNNPKLTLTQKKKRNKSGLCEHWELTPEKEQRQEIEQVLCDIAEQLSTIAEILKK